VCYPFARCQAHDFLFGESKFWMTRAARDANLIVLVFGSQTPAPLVSPHFRRANLLGSVLVQRYRMIFAMTMEVNNRY
jgi:hypothetical protein